MRPFVIYDLNYDPTGKYRATQDNMTVVGDSAERPYLSAFPQQGITGQDDATCMCDTIGFMESVD